MMGFPMKERLFTQGEVNKIFGHIPSRTIRFWVESGLVEWSGTHEDRRGVHREYSIKNLWQLGLAEELMSLNLAVKFAKILMQVVNYMMQELWLTHTLIVPKGKPRPKEEYAGIAPNQPGLHGAMVLPTETIGNLWTPEMEGMIGDPILVVMVNLRKVIDKVDYFIKIAGV
jgi:DNA-binding transcriptional MerR regulator